ncbi:uncharacterized protein K441DRAFT_655695 [Cenococcum geophilum 1.58]|uniref:uncharacterized protein n=1 Tax=Cenococcum geophilum 1.58 TaxID=794803 RepID=UPI00358F3C59|nr:hypothetical protein K441DRAFT_655695 [Cenococcum geophilum 1.58]
MCLQIGALILLFLVLALRAPANPPQHFQLPDAVPHACRCRPCMYNRGRAFQSSTTNTILLQCASLFPRFCEEFSRRKGCNP